MAKWTFEPGHTAAEFRARHMMVTYVRGHFKNIQGTLEFDPEDPSNSSVEVRIDARGIWTGVEQRDDHLRSADFLDAENHPEITFKGNQVEVKGEHDFAVTGNLTIRGVTHSAILNVSYLGQWETPWWEDGVDKGPKTRAGFLNGRGGGAPGIEIGFLKPVRPGDTLTMLARVTETKISRSRPDRGFVSFQSRVTNQSEEDVMTLSFKAIIRTRPKTS